MRTRGFFWHIHHDLLIEWSSDVQERLDYIRQNKNGEEVDLRIKLLKPAKLPAALNTIVGRYSHFNDVPRKYQRQIITLHKKQCQAGRCPWRSDDSLYGDIFTHWDRDRARYWLKPLPKKSKAKK